VMSLHTRFLIRVVQVAPQGRLQQNSIGTRCM